MAFILADGHMHVCICISVYEHVSLWCRGYTFLYILTDPGDSIRRAFILANEYHMHVCMRVRMCLAEKECYVG
jgi:hypothetical protein